MTADRTIGRGAWAVFLLLQVGVMLAAISSESLWIDEFWTAHFATLRTPQALIDLLLVPSGSQTPLHFGWYYLWGQVFGAGELALRLANLPLFVLGQAALFRALRAWPRRQAWTVLALGALHPMVWQYANEARPYIMMYCGAQLIVAYLLTLHAPGGSRGRLGALDSATFVAGAVLLFGASLLGVFWVFAAAVHVAWFHVRERDAAYLKRTSTWVWLALGGALTGLLLAYYLASLLKGAGASRLSSTTPATMAFALYELLGLSGIGPGRLELRDAGIAALRPHAAALALAAALVLAALASGVRAAAGLLGARRLLGLGLLAIFPLAVVLASGFAMHWRVLGRHLIATLPLLDLVLALGLVRLFEAGAGRGRLLRRAVAVACASVLLLSSLELRLAPRHRKDDYRAAAAIAQQAAALGQRVWWAADAVGANYYGLPGEFDFMGELTGVHQPPVCTDRPGVQSIANAVSTCLRTLSAPDIVVLSKPEVFDRSGDIGTYLKDAKFARVRDLPAFTIWRPSGTATPARQGIP